MRRLSRNQLGGTGRKGEDAAAEYLASQGYVIEERNSVFGKYEIDIIASDDRFVLFCEVKTTASAPDPAKRFGPPSSRVTAEKKKNLTAAARSYLKTYGKRRLPRMDVIEVYFTDGDDEPRINHIKNAFSG